MFDINKKMEFINVPYKKVNGKEQYIDIYFPKQIKENMPVLIYVHGGGFLWYNKDLVNENHRINHTSYKDRLNSMGYIFISVEYRMTKDLQYPCLEGQISDVKDAIKWVKKNQGLIKCDPEKIGLWGLSAGGALALAAALNPDNSYQTSYPNYNSEVKYVIDFYGITDIYQFYNIENYSNMTLEDLDKEYYRIDTHTNISSKNIDNYKKIKEYVDQHSPLYNYGKTDIKIAIHHGNQDKQVSYEKNALPLYEKGMLLSNEIYLTTYHGKDHGFWWDTPDFYESLENRVIDEVENFTK